MLWSTLHGSHMVYITSGVSLLKILMPPWPGVGICQILRLATKRTMDPHAMDPHTAHACMYPTNIPFKLV